jgi:hypothetical protein
LKQVIVCSVLSRRGRTVRQADRFENLRKFMPAVYKIRKKCYNNLQLGKGGRTMDVRVGDKLIMKKNHPCGSNEFEVLRIGMDFRIRCLGCGREVMVPRVKAEKNIKRIERAEKD